MSNFSITVPTERVPPERTGGRQVLGGGKTRAAAAKNAAKVLERNPAIKSVDIEDADGVVVETVTRPVAAKA